MSTMLISGQSNNLNYHNLVSSSGQIDIRSVDGMTGGETAMPLRNAQLDELAVGLNLDLASITGF